MLRLRVLTNPIERVLVEPLRGNNWTLNRRVQYNKEVKNGIHIGM